MGVVLGEGADPEEAVKGPGGLVAVNVAELADADGQILIGMEGVVVGQDGAGAIHRLDGEVLVVDLGRVHVVLVMAPMAANLPKLAGEHGRGLDLHITLAGVDLPPIGDELVFKRHPLGQEEGEPGPVVAYHEKAKLLADLPVVVVLPFLEYLEVFL